MWVSYTDNQCGQKQLHARRSAGAGEIKEINMDRDTIIDGLRMTMALCVFDPSTGEEIEPHLLNDINRATYDACKGALEILERLDTDSDTISRQAVIDALDKRFDSIPMEQTTEILLLRKDLRNLPSAQPQRMSGKWTYGEDEYGIDGYHCDKCGFFVPWDYTHKFIDFIKDYHFCPNCGADMREVDE